MEGSENAFGEGFRGGATPLLVFVQFWIFLIFALCGNSEYAPQPEDHLDAVGRCGLGLKPIASGECRTNASSCYRTSRSAHHDLQNTER